MGFELEYCRLCTVFGVDWSNPVTFVNLVVYFFWIELKVSCQHLQCRLWYCCKSLIPLLSKMLSFLVTYSSICSFSTIFSRLETLFWSFFSVAVSRADMLLALTSDALLAEDDFFCWWCFSTHFW